MSGPHSRQRQHHVFERESGWTRCAPAGRRRASRSRWPPLTPRRTASPKSPPGTPAWPRWTPVRPSDGRSAGRRATMTASGSRSAKTASLFAVKRPASCWAYSKRSVNEPLVNSSMVSHSLPDTLQQSGVARCLDGPPDSAGRSSRDLLRTLAAHVVPVAQKLGDGLSGHRPEVYPSGSEIRLSGSWRRRRMRAGR